jgi:hypothetical protein
MKLATLSCLAQSNFPSSLHLKKHEADQKFHENREVKKEKQVTTRLLAQATEFRDVGMHNLIPRLNKCLDKDSDCVEI